MTLSDLAKHSVTRSVARSLCDIWASCFTWVWLGRIKKIGPTSNADAAENGEPQLRTKHAMIAAKCNHPLPYIPLPMDAAAAAAAAAGGGGASRRSPSSH